MEWLDRGIQNIINLFAYDVHIVQQDFNIYCSCRHHSNQADPTCLKCLGTGHKIYIRSIKAYSEDHKQSVRQSFSSEPIVTTEYFIRSSYPVERKNILVEPAEAFVIHDLDHLKSRDRRFVYQLCYTYPKKADNDVFMKNFYLLIKGGNDI